MVEYWNKIRIFALILAFYQSITAQIVMLRVLFVFIALTVGAVSLAEGVHIPDNLEEALSMLDKALAKRQLYINKRMSRIDSLKEVASNADEKRLLTLYSTIGEEYRTYNVDSAIHYYLKGHELSCRMNDDMQSMHYKLMVSSIMPIVGVVKEEVDFFDSIQVADLHRDLVPTYYYSGCQLYYYMQQFYTEFPKLQRKYTDKAMEFNDLLLNYLDSKTPVAMLYRAQSQLMHNQNTLAMATLNDMLEITPIEDNLYARGANKLALCYQIRNKHREQMYYLALSALSDVWNGTLEEASLMKLGTALYKEGDVRRAYRYLTISIDNAVACGAKMRALQASLALPYISQNYKEKEVRMQMWIIGFVVCLIVAIIALVAVVVLLRRDMTKLRTLKCRLSEANESKEAYNSRFLNLSSIYMDKLEEFNRFAGRKIAAKQVDELYAFVKSGKIMEEQRKLFYEVFDKAFVHTYPDFVDEVNALLQDDKQIVLAEGVLLNTELRIIAFMRLGVDDSNQIARFLNLSLNTIYTYRNKLKSRAKKRDVFESDVMKIGRID